MKDGMNCKTCKWWVRDSFGSGTNGPHCDGSLSECRIGPPVCLEKQNAPYHRTGAWPLTAPSDYCGKWEPDDSSLQKTQGSDHIVDADEKVSDHPVDATAMIPEGYVLVPVEPTEIAVVDSFTGRFGVAVNGQEVKYLYDGKPHAGPVNFTFKADAKRAAFIAQQAVKMVIQAAQKGVGHG